MPGHRLERFDVLLCAAQILTEAAEGGWGLLGTAFGKEEFAALAAKARAAQ